MAKNNIDLKDFFLKKGEKVGLVVAGLAMIGLCAGGVMAFMESDSPTKTAGDISNRAQTVERRIQTGEAKTSADLAQEVKDQVRGDPISIDTYRCLAEIFRASNPNDNKRRNPEVMGVGETQVDLIRGPVAVNDIIEEGGKLKVGVLDPISSAGTPPSTARKKTRLELYKEKLEKTNPAAAAAIFGQQPQAVAGYANLNRLQAMVGSGATEAGDKYRIVYKPLGPEIKSDKLASAMFPTRMVVVNASFPYQAQLDAFRRALRLNSVQDLLKEKESIPQFLGVNVQRRELRPGINLKEDEGWEDLDTDKDRGQRWTTYSWLIRRAVEVEPEEDRYTKTVIFNKLLVMPRPKLGRDDAYAKYPDLKLPTIDATVAKFEKSSGKGTTLDQSPLMQKLDPSKDIFDTDEPKTEFREMPTFTSGTDKKDKELIVPDHCLMRFVDVTVKPGYTYQYRIQVKLANPNRGKDSLVAFPALAVPEEILGPWTPGPSQEPITITVPEDLYYYAVDEKQPISSQRDRTAIQVQQWLAAVRLDPDNRASEVPVADWVIGNVPVSRGELISRRVTNVDVLMYYPTREAYDLVRTRPKGSTQLQGIAVDFATPDLLVDFEGGKTQNYIYKTPGGQNRSVTDDGSMELLILRPDGKLQVRATGIDLRDSDRLARSDDLQKRVTDARNRGPAATGATGIFGPR